jgi:hypothetical protein
MQEENILSLSADDSNWGMNVLPAHKSQGK